MALARIERIGAACIVLAALACGSVRPMPPPQDSQAGNDERYVIGVGDGLRIDVWKNPELSLEVPVRPDGNISVPLLDDVAAAGLTPIELKELITHELAEFVEYPDVTVVVRLIGSKRVHVVGAVGREGPVLLNVPYRVLDAIASAGGFSPFANKRNVRVIRQTSEGEVEYRFNYPRYVAGKAPGTNILLVPGDTIIVPD
jgi:polysaccharide biosynthesis/export protein